MTTRDKKTSNILNGKIESKKKKSKLRLSTNGRVFINGLFVILLLFALSFSIFLSFSVTKSETVKYTDKSLIDYRVYLKKNDFYDVEYLEKGMAYVASLIDKINIQFQYDFLVDKNNDIDLNYKVMAKLVIASQSNSKVFYENESELVTEEQTQIKDKKYSFEKEVSIDYDEYNTLANRFKSRYGVNTKSYLEVYLQVEENTDKESAYHLNNETKTSLIIPLSEQEINIGLEENTINETKKIVLPSKFKLGEQKYLILDVVLFVLLLIELVRLFKNISVIKSKKSSYDRYVNRLLRGYDRLIVNVKTAPNMDDYNVIKVENFDELLDLRDNIKEPIRYYVITEHQKCEFFITNHNDLYLYVVKSIDLEQE